MLTLKVQSSTPTSPPRQVGIVSNTYDGIVELERSGHPFDGMRFSSKNVVTVADDQDEDGPEASAADKKLPLRCCVVRGSGPGGAVALVKVCPNHPARPEKQKSLKLNLKKGELG